VTALLRRWRQGMAPGVAPELRVDLRRRRLGGVACVAGEIEATAARWGEVVRAVAGAVCDGVGVHTVGQVTIVDREPPLLASFAPRRDVVASRVVAALTAGAAHRRPVLWLALSEGLFLAEAVDPERPFEASPDAVAAVIRSRRAVHAVLTDAASRSGRVVLRFALYAPPRAAPALVRLARRHLAPLRGWTSAR
jgi:hypothetical protein